MNKYIIIYMNCHATPIIKFFKTCFPECNIKYITTYKSIECKDEKIYNKYIEEVKKCDVFIYNPIKSEYDMWCSQNFLDNLKKDAISIKIPYMKNNLYFMGDRYYDLKEFGGVNNYKNILRGNIPKECLIQFFSQYKEVTDDNYHQIFSLYNDILKDQEDKIIEHINIELELFEKYDKLSDIQMFDFFKNNYKKDKLFINYDHPSIFYFRELFVRILKYIKMKDETFYFCTEDIPYFKKEEHPLAEYEVPILKYVKLYGCFEFDDSENICLYDNFFVNYKDFLKIYLFLLFRKEYSNKFLINNNNKIIFNNIIKYIL